MYRPSALYINIPFCRKICPFCSFAVIRDDLGKHTQYIDLIRQEFSLINQEHETAFDKIQSIYFGGGTPSRLAPNLLRSLVDWIKIILPTPRDVQWSIEVNPEDITLPYAYKLQELGFSRVSIGVQSFLSEGLRQLGRSHHPHHSRNTIKNLRQAGFEDINLDLMFAYPGQTLTTLLADLEEFVQWEPTHVSIYALSIEEKTNFARQPDLEKWQTDNEELISQMYETVVHYLAERGIKQYEISNFARPGYQSRQNLVYWSGNNYLGLGLGSHSLIHPFRWANHRRWIEYHQCLEAGQPPIQEKEMLTTEAKINETLLIQLRLVDGLDLKSFSVGFNLDLETHWSSKLNDYKRSNLVKIKNGRLQLTVQGMLLADEITASLAASLP